VKKMWTLASCFLVARNDHDSTRDISGFSGHDW
jgi:hypothetical protein